ncbi:MAG: hypothetical protein R2845_06530 [Thermomicrobiales bacterium]
MMRVVPDPAYAVLGDYASDEAVPLREQMRIDKPIAEQPITYMGDLLRGDLGDSLVTFVNRPGDQIRTVLPYSLELTIAAIFISTCA